MSEQCFHLELAGPETPYPSMEIKRVYSLMNEQIRKNVKGFGFEMSEQQSQDICLLTFTVAKLDDAFDTCSEALLRREMVQEILDAIAGRSKQITGDPQFVWVLSRFCEMVERRKLREVYEGIAREIFACGERKRHCLDPQEFLYLLRREAELTTEFMLQVLHQHPPEFRSFAIDFCHSTNLLDDLMDMRGDHEDGSQALAPSLGLYTRLAWGSLKSALAGLKAFPQKLELLAMSLSFLPWICRSIGIQESAPLRVKVIWGQAKESEVWTKNCIKH